MMWGCLIKAEIILFNIEIAIIQNNYSLKTNVFLTVDVLEL